MTVNFTDEREGLDGGDGDTAVMETTRERFHRRGMAGRVKEELKGDTELETCAGGYGGNDGDEFRRCAEDWTPVAALSGKKREMTTSVKL